jgi:hypothetical protein
MKHLDSGSQNCGCRRNSDLPPAAYYRGCDVSPILHSVEAYFSYSFVRASSCSSEIRSAGSDPEHAPAHGNNVVANVTRACVKDLRVGHLLRFVKPGDYLSVSKGARISTRRYDDADRWLRRPTQHML